MTMARWHWVSYVILNRASASPAGHGSIHLEMELPETENDVFKLADRITDISHDRNTILPGQYVQRAVVVSDG
jgi:hypothetical protein